MKNPISKSVMILACISMLAYSCRKEDDTTPKETGTNLKQTSEDHTMMDNEFSTIFNTVDEVATGDSSIKSGINILPLCATSTFVTATKTLTIDFGTTNCLCGDGLNRRGKIIAVFDGKYRTKGTKVTVTLEDYYVSDIQFKGTKVIENLGNATGNFKYSYKVTGAQAITSNGTISWETNATIERTQGDATLSPWDDVYDGIGQSSGINRKGESFTVTVDPAKPLIRKISLDPLCWRNFVAGVLTIEDNNNNVFKIDYDPTNEQKCDKEAQLTINGSAPITIILR